MDHNNVEISDQKLSSPEKSTNPNIDSVNSDQKGDVFCFQECSDLVDKMCPKEQMKETPLEVKTEDADGLSDYSSGTEDYLDASEAVAEEDIEMDDEALKEHQKCWSEEDIQKNKEAAQSLKNEGNVHFKSGQYTDAVKFYSRALNTCPLLCNEERSVLYSNRAAARIYLELKEEAILDCNKAIDLNPNYLKALQRRAELHRKMENLDQSLVDYQKVLEMDPSSYEARQACMTLPHEIAERNEKLKAEMMGKLKDLGNLVLRPFGLSTENFNLVQDPSSGSYSVNFQNKS